MTDRVALVTGAGTGLGEAIARGLAGRGFAVSVVDIDGDAAERVAADLRQAGAAAVGIQADVADEEDAVRVMDSTRRALDDVDTLVANAGIGDRAPAEQMTLDQWDRVIRTNLRGVWIYDQAVGRRLIETGRPGSIVNMASIAGQVGVMSGNANYSASKGGVIALTRCLAVEWARFGIRVNAIAPTHFATPLVSEAIRQRDELRDYFLENIPLGRLGTVEEIVEPALFLVSEGASMVTGHVLNVDGGHTAR